jgi:hypothetical protein
MAVQTENFLSKFGRSKPFKQDQRPGRYDLKDIELGSSVFQTRRLNFGLDRQFQISNLTRHFHFFKGYAKKVQRQK